MTTTKPTKTINKGGGDDGKVNINERDAGLVVSGTSNAEAGSLVTLSLLNTSWYIDQLKNHLLDKHIPIDKLDAVLGGMLRLVHYFKSEGNNQKMNPRLEAYFKGRLGLASPHTTQVYKTARDIASGRFSDE